MKSPSEKQFQNGPFIQVVKNLFFRAKLKFKLKKKMSKNLWANNGLPTRVIKK